MDADDRIGEILVPAEDLARRVRELAAEISRDYAGRDLVLFHEMQPFALRLLRKNLVERLRELYRDKGARIRMFSAHCPFEYRAITNASAHAARDEHAQAVG